MFLYEVIPGSLMREGVNVGNRSERKVKMMSWTRWVAGAQSCKDHLTECRERTLSIVSIVLLKNKEAGIPIPIG